VRVVWGSGGDGREAVVRHHQHARKQERERERERDLADREAVFLDLLRGKAFFDRNLTGGLRFRGLCAV
jgi:hypothetical protein